MVETAMGLYEKLGMFVGSMVILIVAVWRLSKYIVGLHGSALNSANKHIESLRELNRVSKLEKTELSQRLRDLSEKQAEAIHRTTKAIEHNNTLLQKLIKKPTSDPKVILALKSLENELTDVLSKLN